VRAAKASATVVRDATARDLPSIVGIYNEAIPGRMATADTVAITVESRRAWFNEHGPRQRPLWVVEESGALVGWLSFQSFYGRPAYRATAEISIYLANGSQGRGVGRMLLERAVGEAPKLGLRTLLGFIFGHNTPSLRLFERLGFERWALLPRVAELDGVERDLIIVGRRVGEGSR
jgi:L-amino acid N-acyltransferase YncA